ncbi:hypothetical protein AGMMS49579_10210 [Spirochaetia bacterium]|nr:hypothetical protein AGMMS49579_10210 [Spirochaetia bacterium]
MIHPLWAEDEPKKAGFPYTFSVTPIAGFLYGQGEEIVYLNETNETYLSQLLWDMKPLVYFGTALDFSRKKPLEKWGVFATLSMKFGLPMKTGIMEDRDWDPGLDPSGGLTNYSVSDASIDGAFLLDFLSGASLPIRSVVLGKAYLGLSYMRLKWSGNDGYYQYPYSGRSEGSFTGPIITYSQDWLLLFGGLSASVYVIPKLALSLSFQGGPMLKYTGEDNHPVKNMQYIDRIIGGFYLEPGACIVFSPTERLSLGLNVSWRYIKGKPHGADYGRQTGRDKNGKYALIGNNAGAGYQALDSSLSATIRF